MQLGDFFGDDDLGYDGMMCWDYSLSDINVRASYLSCLNMNKHTTIRACTINKWYLLFHLRLFT